MSYSVSELARLFHLTERRVQQLAKEGIIPKAKRGQYELEAAVEGYVHYLQERASGRQEGTYHDTSDIKRERQRLIKAQADKIEHENQLLRRELITVDFFSQSLHEVASVFTACIDALPGRLAHELAGLQEPAAVKASLFKACRQIRQDTAERLHRLAERIQSDSGGCRTHYGAAAPNTGSVGGQSSTTPPRQC